MLYRGPNSSTLVAPRLRGRAPHGSLPRNVIMSRSWTKNALDTYWLSAATNTRHVWMEKLIKHMRFCNYCALCLCPSFATLLSQTTGCASSSACPATKGANSPHDESQGVHTGAIDEECRACSGEWGEGRGGGGL